MQGAVHCFCCESREFLFAIFQILCDLHGAIIVINYPRVKLLMPNDRALRGVSGNRIK